MKTAGICMMSAGKVWDSDSFQWVKIWPQSFFISILIEIKKKPTGQEVRGEAMSKISVGCNQSPALNANMNLILWIRQLTLLQTWNNKTVCRGKHSVFLHNWIAWDKRSARGSPQGNCRVIASRKCTVVPLTDRLEPNALLSIEAKQMSSSSSRL